MEEKELKAKDIPMGYARCFNDACKRKETCMHYLARVLTNQQERHIGQLLATFCQKKRKKSQKSGKFVALSAFFAQKKSFRRV